MEKKLCKSDCILRVNYLYQAAHVALNGNPANASLARFYLHTMNRVRQKNQIRLDPSIKRTLCKKCGMLLVMGVTATLRHAETRQPHTIIKCLECKNVKRFRTDSQHSLWGTHLEAWRTLPAGINTDSQPTASQGQTASDVATMDCSDPPDNRIQ